MSTIATNPTLALMQALRSLTQSQRAAPAATPVTTPASVDAAGATAAAVADAASNTEALANDTNTATTSAVTDTAATTPANSIAVYESALTGYPVFNLTVPDISYTPPTMEELLLEANQLYSGGYNRQTQAAQKAYADALADLQRTYAQNRENVQNAATARGFGRSNYVTDALAQLGDREALAQQRNAEQLLQQLNNLGLDYENQMSAYASQQYRAGQQQAYENELLKAQLQMELDKLGYQSSVNRFLYEQEHPNLYADPNAVAAVSSGGGGGVVGYNPYWESVDTSAYNGGSSGSSSSGSSRRSSSSRSSNSNGNGSSSSAVGDAAAQAYLDYVKNRGLAVGDISRQSVLPGINLNVGQTDTATGGIVNPVNLKVPTVKQQAGGGGGTRKNMTK